jgi:hypothetical protein
MAIQYADGTFGPTEDAAKIMEELRAHFDGTKALAKEPIGAVFGKDAAAVEALKHEVREKAALAERIAALEAKVNPKPSIIARPTDSDVAKFGRAATQEEGDA